MDIQQVVRLRIAGSRHIRTLIEKAEFLRITGRLGDAQQLLEQAVGIEVSLQALEDEGGGPDQASD